MSTGRGASWLAGQVEWWVAEARRGSHAAVEQLFGACLAYLLAAASRELSDDLRGRIDAGDVVQDTLLEAWLDFLQFRGQTEAEWLAWLRQILRHNIANERRRHVCSAMRSTRREVPLTQENSLPRSNRAERELDFPGREALTRERCEAVEEAMRRLPAHYRQALHLHTQKGLSFDEVGRELGCSAEAARKRWRRAAQELAQLLGETWQS